jgi:hypothetical protein
MSCGACHGAIGGHHEGFDAADTIVD